MYVCALMVSSETRDVQLFALCRMLDSLVDLLAQREIPEAEGLDVVKAWAPQFDKMLTATAADPFGTTLVRALSALSVERTGVCMVV